MVTIHRSRLLLICLLVTLMIAGVSAAQEDNRFQPVVLEADVPLEGQFEDVYTSILYVFHGSQGDVVSVSMSAEKGLDPYLVLLGANGEILGMDDDSGESAGGARMSALITDVELPYDGGYFVLASDFNYIDGMFGETGPIAAPATFEIMVSGNTVPADGDGFDLEAPLFTATELERGEALDWKLTAEQPVAYLTFEGAAGDTVNIGIDSESLTLTPVIHLFAPDGRRLAMNPVLDGDSSTANLEARELPMDGQYLVITADVFFMDRLQDPEGSYGLGQMSITLE